MAQFDESKVINALHTDKAEVGKKYWFADDIFKLKLYVERDDGAMSGELKVIEPDVFNMDHGYYYLLYPYEEPPKKRWTHKMLTEWCIKANGQYKYKETENGIIHSVHDYFEEDEEKEIDKEIVIRPFGQTEWIEPTVDIYERDCKGDKE